MTRVLEVKDLRTEFRMKSANVVAVDGVSFTVDQGECVGIVGESGCGKSTTGFSIMRLLPANGHLDAGSVVLNGRDLAGLSEKEMRRVRGDEVALIPQDPLTSLNPTMTIGKQISEAVLLHRDVTQKQARNRALEVLTMVEMPRPAERLDQYPHELSGGLRQRVMIAMALACEPKLLIADEPTTALDVTIQAQILDLIDDLRERLRMAVILITHDMGVIAGRTDRVVVMYAGKVAEEAETATLFDGMRHPYTQALLASVPKLDQRASDRLLSIPGLPPDLSKEHHNCRFNPRCQYATDVCRTEEPPLTAVTGEAQPHRFACFHPIDHTIEKVAVQIRTDADPVREARLAELANRETLLKVDRLVKEFPVLSGAVVRRSVGRVHAVSDISFSVRQGETFGLVGESGCGKTTVGRMVVGLERPVSGSITFDGDEVSSLQGQALKTYRRNLQLMFQDPYASLDPRMRVGTIIREPLKVQKMGTPEEQKDRVNELLGEVGLSPQAIDRYPHEFSGGQRQRIGLARALALNPQLIVADEPVSALDVSIQAQILNLMKDLQARHGLTYVMISHDLAVVRYMADTIGVMYLGKLVELGPAADIFSSPAHHYTQGLLDAVPKADVATARARGGAVAVRGELPSAVNPPSGCRFRTRCPAAQDLCAEQEPPLRSFGEGHSAACHFPLQAPASPNELSTASVGS
ncbi:MAG TPA: ABC transporter ATP-binding protein [Acidimicrobiales bacterium]|jgi:oligopeptide/dipeptide ABC transporter ATP-binding protein|nr:ABC transporter ATP-binding protein [Acidimicrobiales bacterium]